MLNLLKTLFPNPIKIFKTTTAVIITLFFIYCFWLIGANLYSWWNYRPFKVVEKFSLILENNTDKITEEEKKMLKEFTDSNLVSNFFKQQERQVLELREFTQGNRVQIGEIKYDNSLKTSAKVELTFENSFENPESKKATLFLQRTGDWYLFGYRWKIYEIKMPSKPNPVDNIQRDLTKNTRDLKERTKDFLDKIFNPDKSNSSTSNNS